MATKRDVTELWARKEGIPYKESLRRLESLVDTLKEMLIEGDEIIVSCFLRARVDVVKPHTVKNLFGKGRDVAVAEKRRLIFKPSGRFKSDIEREAI